MTTRGAPHKHLRRLDRVWIEPAIYFVTTCVAGRKPILLRPEIMAILSSEFEAAPDRHGWTVGQFIVMPDHLHFFCWEGGGSTVESLSHFMAAFKQWTAKRILRETNAIAPLWQPQFFDHVLRTAESYEEKLRYVQENPVRARFVAKTEDWPWQGEISELTR
jgi:putative transposase